MLADRVVAAEDGRTAEAAAVPEPTTIAGDAGGVADPRGQAAVGARAEI